MRIWSYLKLYRAIRRVPLRMLVSHTHILTYSHTHILTYLISLTFRYRILMPYLLTYYTYYTYLCDFTICSFEYTNAYLELSEAIWSHLKLYSYIRRVPLRMLVSHTHILTYSHTNILTYLISLTVITLISCSGDIEWWGLLRPQLDSFVPRHSTRFRIRNRLLERKTIFHHRDVGITHIYHRIAKHSVAT